MGGTTCITLSRVGVKFGGHYPKLCVLSFIFIIL